MHSKKEVVKRNFSGCLCWALLIWFINLPSSYLSPWNKSVLWFIVFEGFADCVSFWSNIVFLSEGDAGRSVLIVGITSTPPLYNVLHNLCLVSFFICYIATNTPVPSLSLHIVFQENTIATTMNFGSRKTKQGREENREKGKNLHFWIYCKLFVSCISCWW